MLQGGASVMVIAAALRDARLSTYMMEGVGVIA